MFCVGVFSLVRRPSVPIEIVGLPKYDKLTSEEKEVG